MDHYIYHATAPNDVPTWYQGADAQLVSHDLIISDIQSYMRSPEKFIFRQYDVFYQIVCFKTENGRHIVDLKKHDANKDCHLNQSIMQHKGVYPNIAAGMVINFSELFFKSFLADVNYISDLFLSISSNIYSPVCINTEDQLFVETLLKQIKIGYDSGYSNYDLTRIHLLHLLVKVKMQLTVAHDLKFSRNYYLSTFETLIEKYFLSKRFPKDYAELLFITPSHLNAVCIQFAGKSAGDLIRGRVLLEAKRLLMNSTLTINEIAVHLNFDTHSYFSRFFKKEENISPGGFKRKFNAG